MGWGAFTIASLVTTILHVFPGTNEEGTAANTLGMVLGILILSLYCCAPTLGLAAFGGWVGGLIGEKESRHSTSKPTGEPELEDVTSQPIQMGRVEPERQSRRLIPAVGAKSGFEADVSGRVARQLTSASDTVVAATDERDPMYPEPLGEASLEETSDNTKRARILAAQPSALQGPVEVKFPYASSAHHADILIVAFAMLRHFSRGQRPPHSVRGLAQGGLGILLAAVVTGIALGITTTVRAPTAAIGSVHIGLDVGLDAYDQPIILGSTNDFYSGNSFGFVAAVAPGRAFNSNSLTMLVETQNASGEWIQVTAKSLPAKPQWTAHAYRLNLIDDMMGTCHGTHFTFEVRDNGVELGAAQFNYFDCGVLPNPVRGHLVFGASALMAPDGVTTYIKSPTTRFVAGDHFTVVGVTGSTLPSSQTLLVTVVQRSPTKTPRVVYNQQITVFAPHGATSFSLSFDPIDVMMKNCDPKGSQIYTISIYGVRPPLLLLGAFVFSSCDAAPNGTRSGHQASMRHNRYVGQ
jgi:hypothetical protein